ncbi:MAG: DUF433 domain-containing protein [Cyanobacteria bacterium J06623_5]
MNTNLAESLADAVVALPSQDYALFQEALITKMIQKTPGVAGGYACIRNTRIAVWTLVSLMNQGADETELLRNFPGLTRFDLLTAHFYYQSHRDEINVLITEHNKEDGDGWVDV